MNCLEEFLRFDLNGMNMKYAFCLAVSFWCTGFGDASAVPPSHEKIVALIKQLGDHETEKRDAASRQLIEIGAAAKAQLEAAIRQDEEVIRRRARLVLANIVRRENHFNETDKVQDFLDKKPGVSLPSWKHFVQAVGENADDFRQFFVELYLAETDLLTAYEGNPKQAEALLRSRLGKLPTHLTIKTNRLGIKQPAGLSFTSLAALQLVAGEKQIPTSELETRAWYRLLVDPAIVNSFRESPNQQPVQKLLERWLRQANDDVRLLYKLPFIKYKMDLAVKYGLKQEGPAVAERVLKGGQSRFYDEALLLIGTLGNQSHIEVLESCLANDAKMRIGQRANGAEAILASDLALAMLVHLTDQPMDAYGFKNAVENKKLDGEYCYAKESLYFKSVAAREKALAKWQAWAEENLKDEKAAKLKSTR